jgi:hypothetical protein
MKLKIKGEFIYDAELMHGDDKEDEQWFFKDILLGEKLIVHSNEIGDEIGILKIKEIKKDG